MSCLGKKVDCAGVIGGSKKVDHCGVCGGNSSTCDLKAVYIHWGHTTCPSSAKVLFEGYAAGYLSLHIARSIVFNISCFRSHDTHKGGGYNSLCVHRYKH